jgi:DNA-binding response OmpR family regulator
MSSTASILVVEDDPITRRIMSRSLQSEGWRVSTASTSRDASALIERYSFDLIVLDRLLPDGEGLALCRELRGRSTVPVLFVSSKDRPQDVVDGLNVGADDYLRKPFDSSELLARARVLLRRRSQFQSDRIVRTGDLQIDRERRTVTLKGRALALAPREYDLLELLAARLSVPVRREAIVGALWPDAESLRILNVYVHSLRSKIEREPARPRYLRTVRGFGYALADVVSPSTPRAA